MTNDEIRRNDEIRMTKPAIAQLRAFRHSGFGFLSSFVIRHSIHWTVLLLGPALLFLFGFGGSAFVVEVNDLGDTLRWHLNPLNRPSRPIRLTKGSTRMWSI